MRENNMISPHRSGTPFERRPFFRAMATACAMFLLAFLFIALFSSTTSPLFYGQEITDSAIFQIIGKYWDEGFLPYHDFFDNKGPYLYMINALGYLLTRSRLGVWLLQIVNMTVVFCVCYNIFLLRFKPRTSILLTVTAAASLASCTEGGNSAEEYCLPFICLSVYLVGKWLKTKRYCHPISFAFVYGITFGIAAMTRLTNALGLFGIIVVIVIHLFCRHQWRNLGLNCLAFLVGTAAVIAPFTLYFTSKGILSDAWYAVFGFNFEYIRGSRLDDLTLFDAIKWLKAYINAYVLFFISLYYIKKNRLEGCIWLMATLLPLIWFVSGQRYAHYAIIALPYYCVSICLINSKVIRTVFVALACFLGIYEVRSSYKIYHEKDKMQDCYTSILKTIPKEDQAHVIGYNVSPGFYYYNNIRPIYPYFTIQEMGPQMGMTIKSKLRACFQNGRATWIIVYKESSSINDILHRRYRLIKSYANDDIYLYRLR